MRLLHQMWRHRHLVLSFVHREYQLRYRQSMMGFFWAVLPTLGTAGAATLVFREVIGVDTGDASYPVFALAALAPWTLFASGLTFGVPSMVRFQSMVSRLAFPRATIPIGMVGTSCIDLCVSLAAFVIIAYATGHPLPVTALWLPVLLTIELVLVLGVVLLGSAINIFARDLRVAAPLLAQFWLFVTPVMYPLSSVPESLHRWYLLNPMTGLVESFRSILVYGKGLQMDLLVPAVSGAAVLLVIGIWYFKATEKRFADVI